jgi:multicomponent K+:H+ antiporter subunit D
MLLSPALRVQRVLALVSGAALVLLGALLVAHCAETGEQAYALGAWPAPFGIVLVADRAAALLVAVTAVVGFAALLAALGDWDARGPYFHPLLQLELAGLNGAFLTGDLFNLFVSFELLLIASFCLLLHGLGRERLRAALHYVIFNLVASAAFLAGAALMYGVAGTLNLADLAARIPQLAASERPLAHAAALLLLGAFGAKAAAFPLSFWLPGAYAAASPPVAALFALMTKVGVYAIMRVHVVVFGPGAGDLAGLASPWLLGGAFGALAAERLGRLAAYLTLVSVGTMLLGVAVLDRQGLSGALYYLAQSSLALAALFLLVPLYAGARGTLEDRLVRGPAAQRPVLLSLLLLAVAVSLAGLPPLPGFFGKLLILQGARDHAAMAWTWAAILVSGALVIVGLARAASALVWASAEPLASPPRLAPPLAYVAPGLLVVALIALAAAAGPLTPYTGAAAEGLLAPRAYIDAVLKR